MPRGGIIGTANICDTMALHTGDLCIIYGKPLDGPVAYWWGRVVGVLEEDGHQLRLDVAAIGGKFKVGSQGEPIRDEVQLDLTLIDCHIYPDTQTTRALIAQLVTP